MKDETAPDDLPSSLRELWNLSGPVLSFRILRDIVGHDESYIETANMEMELLNHPDVQPLIQSQQPHGLWGDFLTTEVTFLHLCELGLENSRAIECARENVLEPTLLNANALWEFERAELDEEGKKLARRIVRDKTLHMLCRSQRDENPVVRTFLEQLLIEWEHYLTAALPLPTADGYAAVCLYPWSDDDFPRVREIVKRLVAHFEESESRNGAPPSLSPHLFRLLDKWQYLEQPPRLFYDLELAATLGVARDLTSTSWMLEELEMRQDADGFFRFPEAGDIHPFWYFPIEKRNPEEFFIEYTFRAELIFKLLEYDL